MNTANTANNGVSDDQTNDFSSPNDLDFEMTAEEEQAFVMEQLGLANDSSDSGDRQEQSSDDDSSDSDDAKDDQSGEEGQEDQDDAKDQAPDESTDKPDSEEKPIQKTEVEPVKTDDLWVEVEKVVTKDGKETTEKVKLVFDPEDPGSFIPDDFIFKNDKQLADILDAKREMQDLYKSRSSEHEKQVQEAESAANKEDVEAKQLASWDSEIQDLIDAGVLTAPKAKPGDTNFLEDEAVKTIDAVFKFMTAENQKRVETGNQPIRSFGTAYTMFANSEQKKADEAAENKKIEDAKRKGSMVGGGSASSGSSVQAGYKPGSHASIWDVPVDA